MVRFLSILAAVLVPFVALAQAVTDPENVASLVKLFADGLRGGDWQLAVLAGILVLVWVVRRVAVNIPKVGAFLKTDEGGALLLILTGVPVALLTSKFAGVAITWGLVSKALVATAGASGLWTVGRRLLRIASPLVAKIPQIGPPLASLLDVLSGAKVKAEIAKATADAYKAPVPVTATQAADTLSKPPVP